MNLNKKKALSLGKANGDPPLFNTGAERQKKGTSHCVQKESQTFPWGVAESVVSRDGGPKAKKN